MTERIPNPAPVHAALALMDDAARKIIEASQAIQRGDMSWRAAVALTEAQNALRRASECCRDAALEVWPIPVKMRGEGQY